MSTESSSFPAATITITTTATNTTSNSFAITTTTNTTSSSFTITTATNTTSSVSLESSCTPTPILPNPTSLFPSGGDDLYTSVTLPFPIGVFGSFDRTVYVSINGRVSLNYQNSNYGNPELPDASLPPISVLAYYDDLVIDPGTDQRVAYQVFGSASANRTVIFEWLAPPLIHPDYFCHFTATFEEALPGIVTFRYYTTTDKGSSATIGAQNLERNQSFVQYSFNSPGAVPDKSFVRLDTTGAGTFTTGSFNTSQC
ncbi:uncharacterized protein ColSpa_03687 [Colletotrichum spaethianum]|uniref:Uncharacterized protein n=1 Tax=Colletotrichum spaethianum TaxID=700344 RepID=A0AA37P5D9_9PEZI|nr:uncharacterized protein ColSpa_03687 [Colletotrichum spaethianum]GKT43506.1 hypothetical protein ColSpa_03687 [Colletotrichum spaethianum]